VPSHAVVCVSGGLDSTVLAYWLRGKGIELSLVSVNYGQRHRVELRYAAGVAGAIGARHYEVDLAGYGAMLTGSALTDACVAVPDGHYTHESMRATVVPNRNAIMLDLAVGLAIATGAEAVAFGAHVGDHAIYPDCRTPFLDAYRQAVAVANEGFLPTGFTVEAPFARLSKGDIVAVGASLSVPFSQTWSCYRGGRVHCGRCGTCVERREAFTTAGFADPTEYADAEVG
jgi:7-cyano-7-deazaguanine synthase